MDGICMYFLMISCFFLVVCFCICFYIFIVNIVVVLLKMEVREFIRVVSIIVIIKLCIFKIMLLN